MGFALARLIELFVGDVPITHDEIAGLMADLFISRHLPLGTTCLEDWLYARWNSVGRVYPSELQRHCR